MMKKIISMLIALSILFSFAVTVNAATGSGNEWTYVSSGTKGQWDSNSVSYTSKKFEGSSSAQIVVTSSGNNRGYYYAPLSNKSASGVYNVSFYTTDLQNNGTAAYNDVVALTATAPNASSNVNAAMALYSDSGAYPNGYTVTEATGVDNLTWYKCEKQQTIADAQYVVFGCGNWNGYMEVDNIVITDDKGVVVFSEGFGTDPAPIAVGTQTVQPTEPEDTDVPLEGIIPLKSGNTWTGEGSPQESYLEFKGKTPIGGTAAQIAAASTRYHAPLKSKSSTNYYNISFYSTNTGADGYNRSVHIDPSTTSNYWGVNNNTYLSYDSSSEWISNWSITPPSDGSVWYKYEGRIYVENGAYVTFGCGSGAGWMEIDEITVKDDNGTVLFYEGFEKGFAPVLKEDSKWQVASTAGYVYNEKGTGVNDTNYLVVNPSNSGTVLWRVPFGYFSAGEELTVSYDTAVSCGGSNLKVGLSRGTMLSTDASWDTTTGYINATEGWTITDLSTNVETTAANCANKWYHVEGKVSYAAGSYTPEYFVLQAKGWEQFRVDNIVVKNSKGEVLFSEDWEGTAASDGHYEWPYYISGAVANGKTDEIVLSWTNPDKAIQAIKIFENGEEIQESQDDINLVDKDAGAFNTFSVYPEDENVHTYTIKYVVDGVLAETEVSGKIGSITPEAGMTNDGYSLKNATFGKHNYATTDVMGGVFIDTDTKYSGNNALRINPNLTKAAVEWNDYERLQLVYNAGGFKVGSKYKLKFMLKVVEGGGVDVSVQKLDWTAAADNWIIDAGAKMTTQWIPVETVFTANDETQYIKFDFRAPSKAVYIDDIVVTDEAGNIVYKEDFEYNAEVTVPVFNAVDTEGEVITPNISTISKGKIEAVATIINGSTKQYDANAYLALYDSKNRLLKVDAVPAEVSAGATVAVRCKIDTSDLAAGTYTLKSFIWKPDLSPIQTASITGTIAAE